MDGSPGESSAGAANKKRKRVSRACDACFSKKDRCDGVQPICKVCKNLGRPCTYNRPERKRGPSQGVRQRLEGQIENLESMLGYMVDTYPQICCEAIKHLRLEDAEEAMTNSSRMFGNGLNTPSPSSSGPQQTAGNIYPHYSKVDAREIWRVSTFAKAVAPSLSLNLGMEDDDDEMNGFEGWKYRIEEARRARSRLRSGITTSSPVLASMQAAHHQQHHQQQHGHHPPPSHMQHQFAHPTPPAPNHMQHMSHPIPPPASHSNHFPPSSSQHYPTKKVQQNRPPTFASSPQPSVPMKSDPGHHPHHHYQPHHHYGHQQQPIDPSFQSGNPVPPQMENFGQQGNNSFDGETDALAYALGLTSYTTSPPTDNFGPRPSGMMAPSTSNQPWMNTPSTGSEQQANQAYHPMHALDQQQGSSSQDDNGPTGMTYFSDLDLNIGQQSSNNHPMSILHQLGLQGSIDMPTPVNTGGDHGDSSSAPPASGASIGSSSTNSHHGPNQWLQPIRGIN